MNEKIEIATLAAYPLTVIGAAVLIVSTCTRRIVFARALSSLNWRRNQASKVVIKMAKLLKRHLIGLMRSLKRLSATISQRFAVLFAENVRILINGK